VFSEFLFLWQQMVLEALNGAAKYTNPIQLPQVLALLGELLTLMDFPPFYFLISKNSFSILNF